jgi:3-hydroxyisobutyrate dehydrogenase-like beta-hydroxyacid dehydrogenase
MKIGFIGLGIMGRPMALNLKKAGHDLIVPERKSLTDDIRSAATVVPDARTTASQSEVVILMVPDTPDVETVLFAPNGAAHGLNRGTLVIDMSSISPIATKEFARRVNEKGCDYLDAPVFAAKAGADPAKVREALMGGFASSRILEVHAERMLNGTFNPGFRIRLHQKDLNLALLAAKDLNLSLPNTAIAQQMFASCAAHDGADLDHSALILAIEGLAGFSIRGKK